MFAYSIKYLYTTYNHKLDAYYSIFWWDVNYKMIEQMFPKQGGVQKIGVVP